MKKTHPIISEKLSTSIDICRVLAIFSVICAHIPYSNNSVNDLIVSGLGTYGVGLFLFFSGSFYERDLKNFNLFALSKIRSIISPWFFCGTIYWSILVARGGRADFISWLELIFVRSHYYYLTVLVILFIMLYRGKKTNTFYIP